MPYIIYTDLESLISKIDGCENNQENSSTTKNSMRIFNVNNLGVLSDSLTEQAKSMIDLEKKKILPFIRKE